MGQFTFSIQYKKNTGIVYSPVELAKLYFFGTPLEDVFGNQIDEETIEYYIQVAQEQIESLLTIKLNRMVYQESKHYKYDDWIQWNYIGTNYPVVAPLSLQGFINTTLQITYPRHWLVSKSQSPDEYMYHRSIQLVPVQGSASSSSPTLVGISPYIGWFGNATVPNYWTIQYHTGFNKVPKDIMDAIGKMAAIPLFTILGDIVLGSAIASKSQSIDGLSQSVNSTASASFSAFSARIRQYEKDLKHAKLVLKRKYVGIRMVAV